jgi:hypothetical protein
MNSTNLSEILDRSNARQSTSSRVSGNRGKVKWHLDNCEKLAGEKAPSDPRE